MALMQHRRFENAQRIQMLTVQSTQLTLFEHNKTLAFCPVLHLLSIALADEAIIGYQTAKQVYDAPLRSGDEAVRYRWKLSMHDLPILRRDSRGNLKNEPARYGTMSTHWRRLVQDAGFQEPASWYALRRSSGNEINGIVGLLH